MRFESPWFLLLLLVLPLWWWSNARQRKPLALQFSSVAGLQSLAQVSLWSNPYILPTLRLLALSLLILALARPQTGRSFTEITSEGVDIVIAVDTSGSMAGLDLKWDNKAVTRLEVVKKVIADFVTKRSTDRLGLVVFGEEAYTQTPLTNDYDLLQGFVERAFLGMAGDRTAIGDAIAVSSKRLKDLKAKSKVIVLMTDGDNNAGKVRPLQAAEVAKELGIKIYTIGIGSKGKVPFEQDGFFGKQLVYAEVTLDEPLLQQIAQITGGSYYRATSTESMQSIYKTIDSLEKTSAKLKEYHEYKEHYYWFLILAAILLLLEFILTHTRLRSLP